MKQKDHQALGMYLLDRVGADVFEGRALRRRLFLLGCICPDYLPFTYLRGFWQSRAMRGHDLPYSKRRIQKSIRRLHQRGVMRLRDSFALGTLMHYLSDSFTFVHTEAFTGSMQTHRLYERALHQSFLRVLGEREPSLVPISDTDRGPFAFLENQRREYLESAPSVEHDCRRIVHACTGIFQTLCAGQRI